MWRNTSSSLSLTLCRAALSSLPRPRAAIAMKQTTRFICLASPALTQRVPCSAVRSSMTLPRSAAASAFLAANSSRLSSPATLTSPLPSPSATITARPFSLHSSSPLQHSSSSPLRSSTVVGMSMGAPSVASPRLVYELTSPPRIRMLAGLTAAQAAFWSFVYYMGVTNPDVPLWWGAVGLTTSLAFAAALHARAQRTITELAVYDHGNSMRLRVSNLLGRPVLLDVPFRDFGPNPHPSLTSKNTPKYWSVKVAGRRGYFIVDRDGDIYDLWNFNRMLGYDVRSTAKAGEEHLIRIVGTEEEQEASAAESARKMSKPLPGQKK